MSDPVQDAIRQAAYVAACRETQSYVARRSKELKPDILPAVAISWLRFRELGEQEQMAVFMALELRATVLTIDRANAIAAAAVAAAGEVDAPAA